MTDKEKIIVKRKKKRVPLAQKPPKIEKSKKTYNRKKDKDKQRKNKRK